MIILFYSIRFYGRFSLRTENTGVPKPVNGFHPLCAENPFSQQLATPLLLSSLHLLFPERIWLNAPGCSLATWYNHGLANPSGDLN